MEYGVSPFKKEPIYCDLYVWLPILLIFCLFGNVFAREIYVVHRQCKIFTLMSNKVFTHCLKCVFSSFCFSITSSFKGVGWSIFSTKFWQEDKWKRNRFVFGNIKINWTPFLLAHQGFTALIIVIKNVFPFLNFSESRQFESNRYEYRK